MFALFATEAAALAHDAAVSAAYGWPSAGTVRYAHPRRTTDGQWAMPVDVGVSTRAFLPPDTPIVTAVTWPPEDADA